MIHEPRFPGFDVLSLSSEWDARTRAVVLARTASQGPIRFFSDEEVPTARALCDRLLAQDGHDVLPLLEMIDDRLARGQGDGYRYEDLPEDGDAWKASVAGLYADAGVLAPGCRFSELAKADQRLVIEQIRTCEGDWHGLPAKRLFSLWMRYCCAAYYSHPRAWNEIGFPGPAYPRGYKNLGIDRREPFEVPESDALDPVRWAERAEQVSAAHRESVAPSGERAAEEGTNEQGP